MTLDPKSFLEKLLAHPGDQNLLNEAKKHAETLIAYLEESDQEWPMLQEEKGADGWNAAIMEALAENALTEADKAMIDALYQANERDERRIGHAFASSLLKDLPPRLTDFDNWFKDLPVVDVEMQQYLLTSPVSKVIPEKIAIGLVKHGFTPLSFLYAIEAVSNLLETAMHYQDLNPASPVSLAYSGKKLTAGPQPLTAEVLIREVEDHCMCDNQSAHALIFWLYHAARYKPWLFRWFVAEPTAEGKLLLHFNRELDLEPSERWRKNSSLIDVGKLLWRKTNPTLKRPNRPQFRKIQQKLRRKNPSINHFDLILIADHYLFPDWACTTLECPLYLPTLNQEGIPTHAWIWKGILNYLPGYYRYDVLSSLWNGKMLEITMSHEIEKWLAFLASKFEPVRKKHPFNSERSLTGAILNRSMEIELEMSFRMEVDLHSAQGKYFHPEKDSKKTGPSARSMSFSEHSRLLGSIPEFEAKIGKSLKSSSQINKDNAVKALDGLKLQEAHVRESLEIAG